ncbi:MAG: HDIG domain-containing protein [Candidatus Melainabacteria bacterium]|nr:HDIG domain-containing protein [Candidatus Melainabacteria bacterium]
MISETRGKTYLERQQMGTVLVLWLLVALAGYVGLLLALGAPHLAGNPLQAGQTAPLDLVATKQAVVIDEVQTRQLRQEAQEEVLPVFKRNHKLDALMLSNLQNRLDQVVNLQKALGLPFSKTFRLSAREQLYLLECPNEAWHRLTTALGVHKTDWESKTSVRPEVEVSIVSKLHKLNPIPGHSSSYALSQLTIIEQTREIYHRLVPNPTPLDHDLLSLATAIDPQEWFSVDSTANQVTQKLLQLGPLFPDSARTDWEQTVFEFLPDKWNETVRLTAARVIASALQPNVVIDSEATRVKAQAFTAKVKPVLREIYVGQVIVPKGSVISADDVLTLKATGITHTRNWNLILSLALSLLAAFALVGVFLHTYEPKHLFSPAATGLMFTVSVVTCGIASFAGHEYPQFVPVPAAALVLTIFFGSRVAVILTLLLVTFLMVDDLVGFSHLIALGTASAAAIGANIRQRRALMLRGFLIGVLQAIGYVLAIILTQSAGSVAEIGRELALQFLGGLSSCIVAIGSLPFLENIFGMVTPYRLAELTDATQPLLRRLEDAAPGTYQHSLAVANLAEAGARAVGGDVNLVRAGALYHDIGKLVRPRFFIENQLGDKNPHDTMSPEESRDRVLAHVTDGLNLARKYDVPKVVQDFIPQHQGTTLMAYFYHKACLRDGFENVDSDFYRYPGPKPQSKETAIVMLADVSEAVTHSLKDPTQEEVEATISTVFKARMDDGQFSESSLTALDLERVKKAFVRVWRTLHHERLKYPSTTTGKMPVPPELPPSPKTSTISQSS